MKSSSREMMVDIAWIIAGNLFLAMGVAWFILPNNVLTGGRNCLRTVASYTAAVDDQRIDGRIICSRFFYIR